MRYIAAILFAALLIVIALLLRKGKGQWLMAGFNTMPAKKKEAYDVAAASKFVSKILMGMACCLLAFDYGWYRDSIAGIVLPWVVFGFLAIFALAYARGYRFRKTQ